MLILANFLFVNNIQKISMFRLEFGCSRLDTAKVCKKYVYPIKCSHSHWYESMAWGFAYLDYVDLQPLIEDISKQLAGWNKVS